MLTLVFYFQKGTSGIHFGPNIVLLEFNLVLLRVKVRYYRIETHPYADISACRISDSNINVKNQHYFVQIFISTLIKHSLWQLKLGKVKKLVTLNEIVIV